MVTITGLYMPLTEAPTGSGVHEDLVHDKLGFEHAQQPSLTSAPGHRQDHSVSLLMRLIMTVINRRAAITPGLGGDYTR